MSLQLMLVDDDEDYRALLSDYLSSLGHTVLMFPSGEDALRHMTETSGEAPSLILTRDRSQSASRG